MGRIDISPQAVRTAAQQLRDLTARTPRPGPQPDRSSASLPIEGKCCLRYYPASCEPTARPLLVVYALVSRSTVLDLQPGDSFIKRMQDLGHPVYLVDWGSPDLVDASVSLADYVCGYLCTAVRLIRGRHAIRTIDLLGICQGGGLALCLASLQPRHFSRLVTMATGVDFHTPGDTLAGLARQLNLPALRASDGNVRGYLVAGLFERLRCLRQAAAHGAPVHTLLDGTVAERHRLLRMFAWQDDYPDQAGLAWQEWVTSCYLENRLVRGTLTLNGQTVDLRRLTMPILNVYARDDHLVPPAAAQALGGLVGPERYVEMEVPCGHLGIFAGRRTLGTLPAALSAFLRRRARGKH